jgi:hypothetical protein
MMNALLTALALAATEPAAPATAPASEASTTTSSGEAAPPVADGAASAGATPDTGSPATNTPAAAAPAVAATPAQTTEDATDAAVPHVLSPTSMEKRRPLITDRPDLTESPYTVDAGHVQIESDLIVATWREGRVDSVDLMPSNMKIGLTSSTDLQLLVPALGVVFGADGTASPAAGDIGVRLKWNAFTSDGGEFAIGVMPWAFVGGTDLRPGGGVIVPVSVALPGETSLGAMVVVNSVPVGKDAYDIEGAGSLTVGHAILGDLAGYLETFASGRPLSGEGELLASAGLTYLLGDSIQFDAGFRLPVLTGDPRVETFLGVSARH